MSCLYGSATEAERRASDAAKEVTQLRERVEQLVHEKARADGAVDELQTKLASESKRAAEAEKESRALDGAARAESVAHARVQQEVEGLRRAVEAERKTAADGAAELASVRKQCNEVVAEARTAVAEANLERQRQTTELSVQADGLAQQLAVAQDEGTKQSAQHEKLMGEIGACRNERESLRTEASRNIKRIEEAVSDAVKANSLADELTAHTVHCLHSSPAT